MEKLFTGIKQWSAKSPKSGGYSRWVLCGAIHKDDSDIDLVLLHPSKEDFLQNQAFTEQFGTVARRQTEYYGACTSIRVWYEEAGRKWSLAFVEPSWIARPLDAGDNARYYRGGYRVILDKSAVSILCSPPYTSPFNK